MPTELAEDFRDTPTRFNSLEIEPQPTPQDSRGLIIVPALIRLVRQSIPPDAEIHWWSHNTHHYYWPEAHYPPNPTPGGPVPLVRAFYELFINRGRMPLSFHGVLHDVTLPPRQPEDEVMKHIVDVEDILRTLFYGISENESWWRRFRDQQDVNNVEELEPYERRKSGLYTVARLEERIDSSDASIKSALERLREIPEDLRLVDMDLPSKFLAKQVGHLMALGKHGPSIRRLINEPIDTHATMISDAGQV